MLSFALGKRSVTTDCVDPMTKIVALRNKNKFLAVLKQEFMWLHNLLEKQ